MRRELGRGAALAIVVLALTDLVRGAQGLSGYWWLGPIGPVAGVGLRLALAGLLGAYVLRPRMRRLRRFATVGIVVAAAAVAARDAATFYLLASAARIETTAPVPLSLAICVFLLVLAAAIARPLHIRRRRGGLIVSGVTAGALLAAFALGQMVTFGATAYLRHADAVVVFGARAYADGTASLALSDRVRTGCELVRQGHASILVVSGGPGDGAYHETAVMKRIARDCGVDEAAIVVDRDGLTTWHTARNLAARWSDARVLAVSHGYHLPRVKLAFERAGVSAYTVPAHETRTLLRMPWYMTREIAAFWLYYLAPA